jgi:hypothetical protein
MIFSGIKLLNINLKMKQLLYQKGENPNPNELEVPLKLYGIHNFWEFFEDKRKRKKFWFITEMHIFSLISLY